MKHLLQGSRLTARLAAFGLFLGAARGACAATAAGVELRGIDRTSVRGTLDAWTADAVSVRREGADAQRVATADLREVVFTGEPPKAQALDRLRVTLVSGEELVADSWGPAPDGLLLTSPAFGEVRVPLEALRWVVPLPARGGLCHDPASRMPSKPGSDVLLLKGGDELTGTVAEVKADGLVVELERGRSRKVAWTELEAAALDNPATAAPTGVTAEVETHAGDLLQAAGPLVGDLATGLALTLRAEKSLKLTVPFAAVRTVRWRGGRCVDATALAFTATYRPPVPWPPGHLGEPNHERNYGVRAGRRPSGCPLRLDGAVWRHGFAVHSWSEIRLPLDGAYRSFEARVGIDDEVREVADSTVEVFGDVDVRVLGDGKTLWEAKGVTGGTPSRAVGPLDVTGVKELVLVVDFGGHDVTLDRATWAEPLLTR